MPAMHAVERADRDCPGAPVELRGCVRDPHRAGTSHRREAPQRVLERDHLGLVRLLDRERPDLGAAEADAMAAERIRQRPDVRPRADVEVDARDARS